MPRNVKVITVVEKDGIPEGSVIQNCKSRTVDGVKFWSGTWSSMWGTYTVTVRQEDCEIWDEEKHDLMFELFAGAGKSHQVSDFIKERLAIEKEARIEREERAELTRLKAKYE